MADLHDGLEAVGTKRPSSSQDETRQPPGVLATPGALTTPATMAMSLSGGESGVAANTNEATIQRKAGLPDAEVGNFFTVAGIIVTRTGLRLAQCDSEQYLKLFAQRAAETEQRRALFSAAAVADTP